MLVLFVVISIHEFNLHLGVSVHGERAVVVADEELVSFKNLLHNHRLLVALLQTAVYKRGCHLWKARCLSV